MLARSSALDAWRDFERMCGGDGMDFRRMLGAWMGGGSRVICRFAGSGEQHAFLEKYSRGAGTDGPWIGGTQLTGCSVGGAKRNGGEEGNGGRPAAMVSVA